MLVKNSEDDFNAIKCGRRFINSKEHVDTVGSPEMLKKILKLCKIFVNFEERQNCKNLK